MKFLSHSQFIIVLIPALAYNSNMNNYKYIQFLQSLLIKFIFKLDSIWNMLSST